MSLSLSTKMLETHMEDKSKAASIAKALNTSYYHHGYAVGRKESKDIGLNVVFPDKEINEIMWAIWLDFCDEMKCNQVFDPFSEVMNNPTAKQILTQLPIVSLPVNIPPHIGQTIIAQIAQKNAQITQQTSIEISNNMAAIESMQKAFAVNNHLSIAYWRDPNMTLTFNITQYSNGWEIVTDRGVEHVYQQQ